MSKKNRKNKIEKCCGCAGIRYTCTNCSCVKNNRICTNCAAIECRNRKNENANNQISIIDVQRDGNCLFRCLSKWLFKTEDHHDEIRQITVKQIEKSMEFYKSQIDINRFKDINGYLKSMIKEGEWGDDVIMSAFSEAYNCNIFAKKMEDKENDWIPYSVWACDHKKPYVTLINIKQNHFQLATNVQRPCHCNSESIIVETYGKYQGQKQDQTGNMNKIGKPETTLDRNDSIIHTSKENKGKESTCGNENKRNGNLSYSSVLIYGNNNTSRYDENKNRKNSECNDNENRKNSECYRVIDKNVNDNVNSNNSVDEENDDRKASYQEENNMINNQTEKKSQIEMINEIYNEIIHYNNNLFIPPACGALEKMMHKMTNLINDYNTDTPEAQIALKKLMIMPKLLLQRPYIKSNTKENIEAFKSRIEMWQKGDLEKLMQEARAIQKKFRKGNKKRKNVDKALNFRTKMEDGQVRQATKMLQDNDEQSILQINRDTLNKLKEKHPTARDAPDSVLIKGPILSVHEAEYNAINAELVKKMAMQTKGSAGPSGMDAKMWRRLLTSNRYAKAARDLAKAIAALTRKMCAKDCQYLEALTANRLIAAKKQHNGIRPIGIGEVLRRIMGKCVMRVVKSNVMEAVGNLQLCAGQEAGAEAAIHATNDIFIDENCQAILMVDAENAFNALNRKAMLHNIARICPPIATYVQNTYSQPARLILDNKHEITSEEGTTQGDPIAMAIYALGFTVLQDKIKYENTKVKQVAFADDLSGAGEIDDLKQWWLKINQSGPALGYHPNSSKSCLIVKPEYYREAKKAFADTNVKITVEGERHLGAVIGSQEFKKKYMEELVKTWVIDIEELAQIAMTEPHAAYTNFTFSTKLKWNYAMRTLKGIEKYLQPLENAIRNKFIPALLGCNVNDDLRTLLSLPPRLGGMGIINPLEIAKDEYSNSSHLADHLKKLIIKQDKSGKVNNQEILDIKKKITKDRELKQKEKLREIEENISDKIERKRLQMTQEKGASSWLTTLPLKDLGFSLNKQEFRDTVALRYSLPVIRNLPITCACGESFTTDHAMICKMGGFVSIRHNEVRDTIQEMMQEICIDVKKEPILIPLSGETISKATSNKQDNARVDLSARDFWSKGERAHFDIRVFDPMAQSYKEENLDKIHLKHEKEKRRTYEERIIRIEKGSFTPLVFTIMGGASTGTQKALSKIAEKLSEKRGTPCSIVMAWLRCKLSFALLRGANLCLRGTRRRKINIQDIKNTNIHTAVVEGKIQV